MKKLLKASRSYQIVLQEDKSRQAGVIFYFCVLAGFWEDIALTETEYKHERLLAMDRLAMVSEPPADRYKVGHQSRKGAKHKNKLDRRRRKKDEKLQKREERRRMKLLQREQRRQAKKEERRQKRILVRGGGMPSHSAEGEGDIVLDGDLNAAASLPSTAEVVHSRQRRAATARPERLWEHAVIPYEIDANFSGK